MRFGWKVDLWANVLLRKVKGQVVRLSRGKNTEGLVLMAAIKLARHRASSNITNQLHLLIGRFPLYFLTLFFSVYVPLIIVYLP